MISNAGFLKVGNRGKQFYGRDTCSSSCSPPSSSPAEPFNPRLMARRVKAKRALFEPEASWKKSIRECNSPKKLNIFQANCFGTRKSQAGKSKTDKKKITGRVSLPVNSQAPATLALFVNSASFAKCTVTPAIF